MMFDNYLWEDGDGEPLTGIQGVPLPTTPRGWAVYYLREAAEDVAQRALALNVEIIIKNGEATIL